MKLAKAIELAEDENRFHPRTTGADRFDMLELLIEAGKRLQRLRSDKHCSPAKLLPGETKEGG